MRSAWTIVAAVALLGACAEKPQTAGGKKVDAKAFDGPVAQDAGYAAPGWKPGDQTSWEQQIKQRNQSQNEYTRTR